MTRGITTAVGILKQTINSTRRRGLNNGKRIIRHYGRIQLLNMDTG